MSPNIIKLSPEMRLINAVEATPMWVSTEHDTFNLYVITKEFIYYATKFPDETGGIIRYKRNPLELLSDNFLAYNDIEDLQSNAVAGDTSNIVWMSDAFEYDIECIRENNEESCKAAIAELYNNNTDSETFNNPEKLIAFDIISGYIDYSWKNGETDSYYTGEKPSRPTPDFVKSWLDDNLFAESGYSAKELTDLFTK